MKLRPRATSWTWSRCSAPAAGTRNNEAARAPGWNHSADYDQNGNVAAISDALSGQPGNRDMSYDDLDRLVGVTADSSQGGNAVFAYDVLDNIRQLDQGTRTVRHTYDGMNRLDTITNAAGTLLSSYNFDTRGNLTSRTTGAVTDTFTFDKANWLAKCYRRCSAAA